MRELGKIKSADGDAVVQLRFENTSLVDLYQVPPPIPSLVAVLTRSRGFYLCALGVVLIVWRKYSV